MFGRITVCLLAFLVSIAVVVNAGPNDPWAIGNISQPSKLIVGHRVPGDRLVLKQSVVKSSKVLRKVTEMRVFAVGKYETITMVKLIDRSKNGKGAIPQVIRGGPGFSGVKLGFESRRGHGIKYEVKIYAKPIPTVAMSQKFSAEQYP